MDKNEAIKRILEEPDFIRAAKYGNSLTRFLNDHPNGVEDETVARLLVITPEEVKSLYAQAVELLQKKMGIK